MFYLRPRLCIYKLPTRGAGGARGGGARGITRTSAEVVERRGVPASEEERCGAGAPEAGPRGAEAGGADERAGGAVQPFMAPAQQMLAKEFELLGSRYCSRQHVIESLEICTRGDVWPLVTETYSLEEAEVVHQRLDQGLVTGRAAIVFSD